MQNLFNRVRGRLRWEFFKFWDAIYKHLVFTPIVMCDEATIQYIINNHVSLSRFGDGELGIIVGHSLNFQNQDKELGLRLANVLVSKNDKLLICLPDVFTNLERYNETEQKFWKAHFFFNRSKWYHYLKKDKIYGNTFVSRFYSMEYNKELAAKRISNLKRLWENRDIVFVEGKDTKLGVGNDLFDNAKSIRRILCPAKNAFLKYTDIKRAALTMPKDILFILALGPTATLLASSLSLAGYQALDLGHMDIEYEWFRMGATSKVPIQGKFTNEALLQGFASTETEGAIESKEYECQIIARIL